MGEKALRMIVMLEQIRVKMCVLDMGGDSAAKGSGLIGGFFDCCSPGRLLCGAWPIATIGLLWDCFSRRKAGRKNGGASDFLGNCSDAPGGTSVYGACWQASTLPHQFCPDRRARAAARSHDDAT